MKKILFTSFIILGLSQAVMACGEKKNMTSTDDSTKQTTVASSSSADN